LLPAPATTVRICWQHQQQQCKFAADVINNGRLCAGVINNGGNWLPALTTMVGVCCASVSNNVGNLLPMSTTIMGVCCRCQQQRWVFSAGVNNNGGAFLPASTTTGGEFAAGVNNNGGNFPPASKTMVRIGCLRNNNGGNLMPASTTTVALCWRNQLHQMQICCRHQQQRWEFAGGVKDTCGNNDSNIRLLANTVQTKY
jgi:hypothetical protein